MIYLDHNSTWPMLDAVREAMLPWLGVPANPASVHRAGQEASAALERARRSVAALLGRPPAGIVFTSGATEANHLGIRGLAASGCALLVAGLEHPSALGACAQAPGPVAALEVGPDGRVELPEALPAGVGLVALTAANHETGVLQPTGAALELALGAGAALHVDATQAVGRVPLELGSASSVALSAHKLGGPCGIGALSLPDAGSLPPLWTGGGQERGRRSGTVPVALAVGFGRACEEAAAHLEARAAVWRGLSASLERALRVLGARIVGAEAPRVPTTTCAVFPGVRGETLVQALDLRGICVSAGAACASGSLDPSPVLIAMGDPDPASAVRVSFGPRTCEADVRGLLEALGAVLPVVRSAARAEAEFNPGSSTPG